MKPKPIDETMEVIIALDPTYACAVCFRFFNVTEVKFQTKYGIACDRCMKMLFNKMEAKIWNSQ